MPVRSVHDHDVLAAALPNFVPARTTTDGLYEDVSDDENFSDCNSEFIDEVARLEREYFDSLDVENSPENAVYSDTNAPLDGNRPKGTLLSDFEKEHFQALNVTPKTLKTLLLSPRMRLISLCLRIPLAFFP